MTGASRGIGAALATHLSTHGCRVYACARSAIAADGVAGRATLDIGDRRAVNRWAATVRAQTNGIDLLVNNAAILGERAGFAAVSAATWRRVLRTNILGTIWVTRAFLPLLAARQGATIVNVGSVLGRFGRAGWSPYAVSKFALEGLTEVLSQELAGRGVRVVTLHPSRVATSLRSAAYGGGEPTPKQNLRAVLDAVTWLLDTPDAPLSGRAFSTNDLPYWANAE